MEGFKATLELFHDKQDFAGDFERGPRKQSGGPETNQVFDALQHRSRLSSDV